MAALAEDSLEGTSTGRRVRNILLALVGIGVVGYGGYWLKSQFSTPSAPSRQVTKISIIPDTPPPPPPPPPREEKRPEPKEQKDVKVEQPKPVEAPPQQAEQLKMEGAAGDGPSAFASGDVTNEYKGGDVGTKIGGDGGNDRVTERMKREYGRAQAACIQRQLRLSPDAKLLEYDLEVTVEFDERGRLKVKRLSEAGGGELSKRLRDQIDITGCPPPSYAQGGSNVFRIQNIYEQR